jgi:hypothetical protein
MGEHATALPSAAAKPTAYPGLEAIGHFPMIAADPGPAQRHIMCSGRRVGALFASIG